MAKHLDDKFIENLIAKARHHARISLFLEKLKNNTNPPIKYDQAPRNLKIPDFIQEEWINKGFNPTEIDRKMLRAYDSKLVRALENYEYNNGLLNVKMRFPKVRNKRSANEIALRQ